MPEPMPPMPPATPEPVESFQSAAGEVLLVDDPRNFRPSPLAPVPPKGKTPVRLGQPLTDLDAAWRLAMNMAGAKNMNRDIRGNAADIFLVFMWGAELNIGPAQALANISIFNGTLVLRGQLVSGLVRRAGHRLEEVVSDDTQATVRLHRTDGQVWEATFTIEDAIRAKLIFRRDDGSLVAKSQNGKELPWQLYTPDMLYWRALGRVVRRGASEVTMGAYIEGEIDDTDEPLANQSMTAMSVQEPTTEDILAEVRAIENTAVAEGLWQAEMEPEPEIVG